jgi:type IV secretory pathway VirB2 component (pilin)
MTFAATDMVGIKKAIGLPGTTYKIGDLSITLQSVIGMLQNITAIIAVLGICIVGIMYIMSRGDEEKTGAAKKYMITILIGVLIAFAAWGMISLVNIIPNSFNL